LDAKLYRQVGRKIFDLQLNGTPADAIKLQGFDGIYRLDVGEYRIVFSISVTDVLIRLIGKRNDDEIYKMLTRL
jgi:mRNA interferase RelE/StbE